MYPEDAIQSLVTPWWTPTQSTTLARGRLVFAYTQHADAHSFVLTVEGRKEPTDPSRARMHLAPARSDLPARAPSPPPLWWWPPPVKRSSCLRPRPLLLQHLAIRRCMHQKASEMRCAMCGARCARARVCERRRQATIGC